MNPPIFVSVSTAPNVPGHVCREVIRYDDFVARLMKPDTDPMTALHIGVGIAGEVFELDSPFSKWAWSGGMEAEHLVEEFGDVEWYLQAAQNFYGVTNVDAFVAVDRLVSVTAIEAGWETLMANTGKLVDCIKREYVYGKPREIKLVLQALHAIRSSLDFFYSVMMPAISREHVLQCNALKLEIRYAKLVYSDQAAIARADKPAGE